MSRLPRGGPPLQVRRVVARRSAVVAGRPVNRHDAVAVPAGPRLGVGVSIAFVGLVIVQDGVSHLAQVECHRVQELEFERSDDVALVVRVRVPNGEFLGRLLDVGLARAAETRPDGSRFLGLGSRDESRAASQKQRQVEKMATRFQGASLDDVVIDHNFQDRLEVDRGQKTHFLSVGYQRDVLGSFGVGVCSVFSVHDSARYHDCFPFMVPASSRAQVRAGV